MGTLESPFGKNATQPASLLRIRSLLAYFFPFYLALVIAAGAIGWPLYGAFVERGESALVNSEKELLAQLQSAIQKDYFESVRDTLQASILYENGVPKNAKEIVLDQVKLTNNIKELMATRDSVESIRFLGIDGKEIVRVDRQANSVPQIAQPIDVSGKYYFRAAKQLQNGQVYVGPYEFNEQGGEPKIIFAAPLYLEDAKLRGFFVFRISCPAFANALKTTQSEAFPATILLFSSEGELLSNRPSSISPNHLPALWSSVQPNDSGSLNTNEGVIVFKTVYPLDGLKNVVSTGDSLKDAARPVNRDSQNYSFKAVAFIPAKLAKASAGIPQREMYVLLGGGSAILAAIAGVAAYLLSKAQATAEFERAQKEEIAGAADELYNNAPCGYHSLDRKGAVVRMNDTELNWLGYSRDQVIGKQYAEFLSDKTRHAFTDDYAHYVRGEPAPPAEQRQEIVRIDGETIDVAITSTAIKDRDGRVVMTSWTVLDISDRIRLERALEGEAHLDQLTNIHNREFFFMLGEREIAWVRRKGGELSLLYIDIDHFRKVNERYGRYAGDRILKNICGVISKGLRTVDIFGRIGGEEFSVLLPGVGRDGAMIVAERLRTSVSEMEMPFLSENPLRVTVSIGIAEFSERTANLEALLNEGQMALYRADRVSQNQIGSDSGESTGSES